MHRALVELTYFLKLYVCSLYVVSSLRKSDDNICCFRSGCAALWCLRSGVCSSCVVGSRGLVSALACQRAAVVLQVCRKSTCAGKFLSAPRISRAHVLAENVCM